MNRAKCPLMNISNHFRRFLVHVKLRMSYSIQTHVNNRGYSAMTSIICWSDDSDDDHDDDDDDVFKSASWSVFTTDHQPNNQYIVSRI